MWQYTTLEQTTKLIELGLPIPKSKVDGNVIYEPDADLEIEWEYAYSIGELIEMLPESASQRLRYVATKRAWIVDADVLGKDGRCYRGCYHRELVEALYVTIIKLKEEGVI